jgi:hypothetical protein
VPQPSDNNAKLGVPTVQCRYVSRIAGHCRLSNERQRMGHPSSHGSTHGIRTVCSNRDADFIFAGKAQPLVHTGVRGRMCAGIDLRLSPRRVAIRSRGSRVVSGRASPLVRHGEATGVQSGRLRELTQPVFPVGSGRHFTSYSRLAPWVAFLRRFAACFRLSPNSLCRALHAPMLTPESDGSNDKRHSFSAKNRLGMGKQNPSIAFGQPSGLPILSNLGDSPVIVTAVF